MKVRPSSNPVTETVSALLIPFMQLYALYLVAHGDLGPGGGFQGGAIFAASLILRAIVFGLDAEEERRYESLGGSLAAAGVLLYGGIGLLCMARGGSFLEYPALPFADPKTAYHLGIYGIETGVGLAVAGAMLLLFMKIAGSRDD
ncbi:MAG: Na(+)/H(+) antiporter subunit B [Elusimicrobiales bacterium]|nr:Na(+)/H(+) antiporter subunit B [Elusimicrobiales bacterium]